MIAVTRLLAAALALPAPPTRIYWPRAGEPRSFRVTLTRRS
jgi:hypothetical protein